jgi:hypothetical protein
LAALTIVKAPTTKVIATELSVPDRAPKDAPPRRFGGPVRFQVGIAYARNPN